MNLDVLSPGKRAVYEKFTEYLNKHPGESVTDAGKALGLNTSYYYVAKLALHKSQKPKRKYTRKAMQTIPVDDTPVQSSQVIAFVGNSRSVVESIRELLK